ncbi:hypothetical protein [Acetivibrio ethanolgignens]|uniref:Uncharacterized protein n=1 Tax=Acetivibrio ethanolgignens TaxID=290052 RepID=A0A0V8QEW9_9FIRM|nr:hypothetical protein [Acetivibrio ethanolgignens]KSV59147.1 hypothetical protein ASU35_10330 [Acetivibrio ethanolgignens]
MERTIYKSEDGKQYFFYDDPEWGVELEKDEVEGVVDIEKKIGFHACNKSGLYDDMEGYIDELQHEKDLPCDKVYVVTYFKLCDDCSDLEQLVDFGITKQQIIDNVIAQKYVEGADYFTMDQLQKGCDKLEELTAFN